MVSIHEKEKALAGSTVLVTGAGGFIGSHLVERLLSIGCKVRGLIHYNSAQNIGHLAGISPELKGEYLEIIHGDLLNEGPIAKAAQGCDYIFHLGALIGIPYSFEAPRSYVDVNITGTLNVLLAAKSAGVKRVVQTSTSEVYGTAQYVPMDEKHPLRPQSPYAASKVAADQLALSFHRSFDLPVVVLRPFNTYGPRQSLRAVIPTICLQAVRGENLTLGNLSAERDFTYVEDTCRGFTLAALSDKALGTTVNLGYGECVSIQELVNMVGKLVGRELTSELDERRLRPHQSEVERLLSDNRLAEQLLDWRPEVSIKAGLEQVLKWVKAGNLTQADSYAV